MVLLLLGSTIVFLLLMILLCLADIYRELRAIRYELQATGNNTALHTGAFLAMSEKIRKSKNGENFPYEKRKRS